MLQKIDLLNFVLENGKLQSKIILYYQIFGQPIGKAPVVLVNHALTGNSNVTGKGPHVVPVLKTCGYNSGSKILY
jgi:homoserine O-acetyltransferase